MYRVAIAAGLAVLVGACSLGSTSLSSGFADSSDTSASVRSSPAVESVALGGEPSTRRADTTEVVAPQRMAKLDDKAPMGSFERAPAGALADRDYTKTALDPDRARDLINQYRRDKGLKPLQLNAELTSAAKAHSRDLAQWDRISHYGSDGSNPWDRVKRAGYGAKIAAENVGTGQATIDEVFKGWQESPGHNKNLLLPDATNMGIALVQDPKTEFKTFWTMVLGTPL